MIKVAIIVAGGSGIRMGTLIPKQFLLLKGRPVLMHTIKKFNDSGIFDQIIVVLPKSQITTWEKLLTEYSFAIPHQVVPGGTSRFESVKNGLNVVKERDGQVAIHDGVRPLVSIDLIQKCMNELSTATNCTPSIVISDSVRKVSEDENEIVDRNLLRSIQTPQCFRLDLIQNAYRLGDSDSTDDASVFEKSGQKVHLIEGEKINIKITVVSDLLIAETLMTS